MPLLKIILGPTAVGKSDYAVNLAREYDSPVISCDSRQIFKEMSIGTAKPSAEQLSAVRHYFIGTHSIHENYTAGLYELEALQLLEELFKSHEVLVMAGGSGLYIDALCNGLDDFPPADQELRDSLNDRLRTEGIESLRQELKMLDPASYETVDIANAQRVIRALEVTLSTGRKFSSFKTNPRKKRFFEIEKTGLIRPREELYERIDRRVDEMMRQGLENEARGLFELRRLPALNTVGYKELFDYFEGKYDIDEAVRLIKRNSRHYAKKQMTWWRRDRDINWIEL